MAPATPPSTSAIAVIRVSGREAIAMADRVFKGKKLQDAPSHTLHYGQIRDEEGVIDEVVVSLFKAPKSYTKEDVVEISCHGSTFVVRKIIQLLLKEGARFADPGEFTQRAFLNGRFDLAQAEAVADLIASDSAAAHQAAINQMRGGFSEKISRLREELIHFASMIELELDFSEEDVEFASRDNLKELVRRLLNTVNPLIDSFDLGNAIKKGIPTVIAGKPNVGKSTLLNAILNEEKAIVSDIPGTTRDFIEDEINIGGITFRFIDTAGLRETLDKIEALGVERTQNKLKQASLILYMFDVTEETPASIRKEIAKLEAEEIPFIPIGNKADLLDEADLKPWEKQPDLLLISATQMDKIDLLKDEILKKVHLDTFKTGDTVVTNMRHYQSLAETKKALEEVLQGIDNQLTNDLLALDLRNALHHLGEITGAVTTDDLLKNIFGKFCIGK